MNQKKLDKLLREIEAARRSPQTATDLERLATLAGRTTYPGSNHLMWMSSITGHRAFPISRHGGNPPVGHRAQKVVLDALEADVAAWQEYLEKHHKSNGDGS